MILKSMYVNLINTIFLNKINKLIINKNVLFKYVYIKKVELNLHYFNQISNDHCFNSHCQLYL